MVRIFFDANGTKDYVVQTTCLDAESFVYELAEALAQCVRHAKVDGEYVAAGILKNAMPIAFKLSGYKADNVHERRTLVCGTAAADKSEMIASVGKE